jgi:tRNA dimethylallyltransferase
MEAPLIVIVGPTASGKSALAIELAEQFGGEIICADSRTVYKGMDIGTAKPSAEDRARVLHWGLDLVEPGERFSAADFKEYANEKIAEIRARGNIPFLVGGTGLYVDGVVFDFGFQPANQELRAKLEVLSLKELYEYCEENNVVLPENTKNKRYVIREIERKNADLERLQEPQRNTIIVGITTNRDVLRERISGRSEQLFADGVVDEAKRLGKKYGWGSEAMTGNIYRLVYEFVQGNITEAELKQKFETADWRLAKRQLTWLKRNPYIKWLELDYAKKYIARRLAERVQ